MALGKDYFHWLLLFVTISKEKNRHEHLGIIYRILYTSAYIQVLRFTVNFKKLKGNKGTHIHMYIQFILTECRS